MIAPTRVWLNRTYAENVFFIDLLRTAPVEVYATHVDADSPVLAAADHGLLEPDGLSAEAYVEFALDFCDRHRIDVFLPRLHQLAIARRHAEFDALGTALICPPAQAIATFESKVDGYVAMAAAGLPVPSWHHVRTADELQRAVEELEDAGEQPCLKPASGAGGEGFRTITREPFHLGQLAGWPSGSVQLGQLAEAIAAAPGPVDLLVMPYLEGPEVSVDCLADPDGRLLAAVGRTKRSRRRSFTTDPVYLEPTRRLIETFGMAYLSNVQFRHHRGVPVLLDINTRPSGGLHQLRLCGLNLPLAAVQLALGRLPVLPRTDELRGQDYALVAGVQPILPPLAAALHQVPVAAAPVRMAAVHQPKPLAALV
ncbi:ATP-grasp domain-containing protein [Kitasatospora sp. CMC57]|uniref:ATP-grasp domain-containing protein n=1 Tax=Kitasatospora sp. CMC57 TaxID=3231513 RepID=A0AB33K0Z4_9ACTN